MKWIELESVLEIYNSVIESTGGSYGVRDKNALESALFSPLATFDGQELYPEIFKKVAVWNLCCNKFDSNSENVIVVSELAQLEFISAVHRRYRLKELN